MCMYQFFRVGYNLGIVWERVSEGPNSVHEDRNFDCKILFNFCDSRTMC